MDDLYGNAWGDPLNDYSNQSYSPPTWDTQPPSPKPQSSVENDQNDNRTNDDESGDLPTGTQFPAETSDVSWTVDAVPWPVEVDPNPYPSAWVSVSPADVWSSTAQPETPTGPTLIPSDDLLPDTPPLTPPLPEEPKKERSASSEQAQGTPIQSRASSPDQFGTFESGNTDAAIPAEEVGWGSPKYPTFDDSVNSSNAWGQQTMTKERDSEAEPVDEWEAARRTKEKLDRRVVCTGSRSFDLDDLLSVYFSLRKSLRASLKPLKHSLRICGQKVHRAVQILKRNGFTAGGVVLIASKACV